MSWFALFDSRGTYQGAVTSLAGYDRNARRRARPIPRAPGDFERWDRKTGAFVVDEAARLRHRAGPAHVAAMHARKAVEAHLIAAGVAPPTLLLVREAALRGIEPAELAAAVLDKIAGAEALELERQAASLTPSE
jgi:hypothetical protein